MVVWAMPPMAAVPRSGTSNRKEAFFHKPLKSYLIENMCKWLMKKGFSSIATAHTTIGSLGLSVTAPF